MRTKFKQVKVNFKEDDFNLLTEIADAKNLTKAEYIRQKLGDFSLDNVREPRGKINDESQKVDTKLLYEIAKIGTNLNQIAHYCNSKKSLDTEVLKKLVSLEKDLSSLL